MFYDVRVLVELMHTQYASYKIVKEIDALTQVLKELDILIEVVLSVESCGLTHRLNPIKNGKVPRL